jgi:nucleotide-binding universal stress UspA family protein
MFNKILAPLDSSPIAESVLPHLVAFADVYEAEVTLVHVVECPIGVDPFQPVDPLEWELCRAEAEAYLDQVAERLSLVNVEAKQVLLEGQPAPCIVEYAQSHQINLIVLSSHGRAGLSRWNVNSVVRKIIQKANISTLIVRAYKPSPEGLDGLLYRRLMAPLDGSLRAECILPTVATLTRFHKAHLILGHVVVKPEMPRLTPLTHEDIDLKDRFVKRNLEVAEQYFDQLLSRTSVDFVPRLLVSENIAISLHQLVDDEEVDLIVISAHGYSGSAKWPYGSLTTSFIEYGTTPLLIVQDLEPGELEISEAEVASKEYTGH